MDLEMARQIGREKTAGPDLQRHAEGFLEGYAACAIRRDNWFGNLIRVLTKIVHSADQHGDSSDPIQEAKEILHQISIERVG